MYALLLKELRIRGKWMIAAFVLIVYFLSIIIDGMMIESVVLGAFTILIVAVNLRQQTHYRLLISLPVTRRMLLQARYIVNVIWVGAVYLTTALLRIVTSAVAKEIRWHTDILFLTLACCLSLILISLCLPLNYRYGLQRMHTIAQIGFVAGIVAMVVGHGEFYNRANRWLSSGDVQLLLVTALLIIAILSLFISYRVSLRIFDRNDV
ncbi:MAG: ABC-2 transporter permease [Sporolactobacillus sp.]|nr:ABC-2 transporter permease [Sporolactobacillus sp.]